VQPTGEYTTDFYDVLGIAFDAPTERIREAHRDWSLVLHPDRLQSAPERTRQRAEAKLRAVNAAWDTLRNADRRRDYDRWYIARHAARPEPVPADPPPPPPAPRRAARPEADVAGDLRARAPAARVARLQPYLVGALAGGAAAVVLALGVVWPRSSTTTAAPPPAAAAPLPALPGGNIIRDGGFEDGGGQWQLDPGFRREAGGLHGGSSLTAPGTGTWSNAYQRVGLAPRGCYVLSLWAKGNGTARVDVIATDPAGEWLAPPLAALDVTRPGPAWTNLFLTFRTADSSRAVIAVRDTTAGEPVQLDQFTLVPCPAA
jgi:curved DNA-binding protein CbpA